MAYQSLRYHQGHRRRKVAEYNARLEIKVIAGSFSLGTTEDPVKHLLPYRHGL